MWDDRSPTYRAGYTDSTEKCLEVLEIWPNEYDGAYEYHRYCLASRVDFSNCDDAIKYTRDLAKQHGLEYKPYDENDHSYLD